MEAPLLYRYLPLDAGFIRIVELHPWKWRLDEELRITIHAYYLDDTPRQPYDAISYTWGDINDQYPVFFPDGTHLMIDSNLQSALRHLRLRDESRWLWIDTICIPLAAQAGGLSTARLSARPVRRESATASG